MATPEEEAAAQAAQKAPIEIAAEQDLAKAAAEIAELKQRLAAAPVPPPPAPLAPDVVAGLAELQAFMVANRAKDRLAQARASGFNAPMLTEEEQLRILPDEDLSTPVGKAKLDALRQARPVFFNTPGPSIASMVAATTIELDPYTQKSNGMFNAGDLINSLFGTKRGK